MPKDISPETHIGITAGQPIALPNGDFVANAEMTRVGPDLHLAANGHVIVIEGYFTQSPAPDLVTHDGARLTPSMVHAFVPPEHAGQYAASGQIVNDATPAGKIIQVVGEAHIIRADGTHIAATVGAPVFQGDVVETSKTGGVNIQFADNTTFVISDSARMSIDQFVYHPADHSGSTFFSILQGVFVYTSGLIGKSDPGDVNIDTPVGSIGIRGTVVAGHILPAGQESQITIVDGAITVTNGSGTQEMNNTFQTISMNSYQAQPETVQMDAKSFSDSYHSVSGVAGDTFAHFAPAPEQPGHEGKEGPAPAQGTAPAEGAAPPPAGTAPHETAPAPAPAPAPTGAIAPPPAPTQDATTVAPTTDVIAPPPILAVAPPPPPPPPPSTFTADTTSTFTTTSTTFTSTTTNTGTIAPPPPPPADQPLPPPPTSTFVPPPPPPPLSIALVADTGPSGADRYTNNGAFVVSGYGPGALVEYSTDGTHWSATPPVAAAGPNTISVRQTALNGAVSAPVSISFILDQAAPGTPSMHLQTDSGNATDTITNDGHIVVTGLETNPYTRIIFSADGGATWSGPMLPGLLPTTWANNVQTHLQIKQIDQAGNISAAGLLNFTYDAVVATPTLQLSNNTGVPNDTITNDGSLSLLGGETGATIEYSTDGGSTWQFAPTLNEGLNQIWVRQTDVAGNMSAPSSTPFTFTLDTVNPAPPDVLLTVNGSHLGIVAPGNTEAGALIEFSLDSGTSWSTTPPVLLNGQPDYTVEIRETDAAGNISGPSANITFHYATATSGTLIGTSGTDFLVDNSNFTGGGSSGFNVADQGATWSKITGGAGGSDVIFGSAGDNNIFISNAGFKLIEGDAGYDRLTLQNTNIDFTNSGTGKVGHIEEIDLGTAGGATVGNNVRLTLANIFDMTTEDGAGNHILHIVESGSFVSTYGTVTVDQSAGALTFNAGLSTGISQDATGAATGNVVFTGTYTDSHSVTHGVTLVIHETGGTGTDGHINIA